jgi:hypothetical protein
LKLLLQHGQVMKNYFYQGKGKWEKKDFPDEACKVENVFAFTFLYQLWYHVLRYTVIICLLSFCLHIIAQVPC